MSYLLLFIVSFLLSWALAWAMRFVAPRVGLIDLPRADRWHRRRVPRAGGVAIYLAFMIPLLLRGPNLPQLAPLIAGGTAIFLVGLIDDFFHLENRSKLMLLIVCAVIPVLLGLRFEMLSPVVGIPLALVWILGATNAFNWLDNMDGVAAGVGAIASANLFVLSLGGRSEMAYVPVLLAGATLGFLAHNYPPARIFMGDSGSGFLGFALATLALMGSYKDVSNVLATLLTPGLILAVPIFDTAVVTAQRLLNRRPLFQGGRDHPAHRLVALGLRERKVVLMLYGLSILSGVVALAASFLSPPAGLSMSVLFALGFVALGLVLSEVRTYDSHPAGNGITPLPLPFRNKRWILFMCVDLALIPIAYYGAHLLRYDGALSASVTSAFVRTLPVVVAAKMVGFYATGVYRGNWRYAGVLDFVRLAQGVLAGSLISVAVVFFWMRLQAFSRAVFVLDGILTLTLIAGSRISVSAIRDYLVAHTENGRRALIVGADGQGALLVRMLRDNSALGYRPVGFVDDDLSRMGSMVQGLAVLGSRKDLGRLIRRHHVEEVLLATPACPPEVVQEIRAQCDVSGVAMKQLGLTLG